MSTRIATEDYVDAAVGGGGGGGGGSGVVLLYDEILNADASTIDIQDIPDTCRDLLIVAQVRGTNPGNNFVHVGVRFNNDSGANQYNSEFHQPNVVFADSDNQTLGTYFMIGSGGSSQAGAAAAMEVTIPNYATSTFHKSWRTKGTHPAGSSDMRIYSASGTWKSTAAIDRITLIPSAGDFLAGTRVTIYGLTGTTPAAPGSTAYLRDEKAAGSNGGTFTSGAWRTRDLNTVVWDNDDIVELAGNEFTPVAGTYEAVIDAPAGFVASHQARLYNVTDAEVVAVGSLEYSGSTASYISNCSRVYARFTTDGTKEYRVEHRCITTAADEGFGSGRNWGDGTPSVFTQVRLEKVA